MLREIKAPITAIQAIEVFEQLAGDTKKIHVGVLQKKLSECADVLDQSTDFDEFSEKENKKQVGRTREDSRSRASSLKEKIDRLSKEAKEGLQ